MEMSKRLRSAIEQQRISVSRLSELSGVPRKTIYHWLNGQKPRNVEQLLHVCRALGLQVEDLFNHPVENQNSDKILSLENLKNDLNAGVFEVILRPIKRNHHG